MHHRDDLGPLAPARDLQRLGRDGLAPGALDRDHVRADAAGHDRAAERLDRKGDRIDRKLDRKGKRSDARNDRRGRRLDRRIDRVTPTKTD